MDPLRQLWVQGKPGLLSPVKPLSRQGHLSIPLLSAFYTLSYITGMSSNPRCNYSLLDVIRVRQRKVLGRGYIA